MDVTAYNSKNYYVLGDVLIPGKLPITGNETVLDALEYAGGLLPTAAPAEHPAGPAGPPGACCEQILPVNLAAITNGGDPTTNYQLMPGDRIIVHRDPIVRFTIFLDRTRRTLPGGRRLGPADDLLHPIPPDPQAVPPGPGRGHEPARRPNSAPAPPGAGSPVA